MKRELTVSANAWHFYLAVWGSWIVGRFFRPKQTGRKFSDYLRLSRNPDSYRVSFTTCSYIRCAFIWSWLVPTLMFIVPGAAFLYAVVIKPASMIGISGLFMGFAQLIAVIIIVILAVGTVVGIVWLMFKMEERFRIKAEASDIGRIVLQRASDKHDRICSLIKPVQNKESTE